MLLNPPHHITINAPSLRNNKLGDTAQRNILIYLPPDYRNNKLKQYPVLYLIHGFGGTAKAWFSDELPLHKITEKLIENGDIAEMIIVVPDNNTTQTCSAYLDSSIQGNWQQFICHDLVKAIESKYRCQPGWENRAIVGHSSGGDCVLKTLLLTPKIFKHGFAMSASGVGSNDPIFLKGLYNQHVKDLEKAHLKQMKIKSLNVWAHIVLSYLQITLPDESTPPLYCKFPLNEHDWKKFSNKDHATRYQRYKTNLKGVNLALDVGSQEDFLEQTRNFVKQAKSDNYNVALFEFKGGHVDHIGKSMIYVLKYINDCFNANIIN